MTKTIAIPNPAVFSQERDLVLIPKDEYQSLLRIKQKGIAEVALTRRQRHAVARSERELHRGDYFTLDELETYLDRTRSQTRR